MENSHRIQETSDPAACASIRFGTQSKRWLRRWGWITKRSATTCAITISVRPTSICDRHRTRSRKSGTAYRNDDVLRGPIDREILAGLALFPYVSSAASHLVVVRYACYISAKLALHICFPS